MTTLNPPQSPPGVLSETQLSLPALRRRQATRTKRRLIGLGVILAAAAGFLLFKVLTSAVVYFETAQQAVTRRTQLGNSVFQIEGTVVRGTERNLGNGILYFTIASGPVRVVVHNTGAPPQLFGPGVPVVLSGHFVGSSNVYASDQILVKHSNQYIAAHPKRVATSNGSVH